MNISVCVSDCVVTHALSSFEISHTHTHTHTHTRNTAPRAHVPSPNISLAEGELDVIVARPGTSLADSELSSMLVLEEQGMYT